MPAMTDKALVYAFKNVHRQITLASIVQGHAYKGYCKHWWWPPFRACVNTTNLNEVIPAYLVQKTGRGGSGIQEVPWASPCCALRTSPPDLVTCFVTAFASRLPPRGGKNDTDITSCSRTHIPTQSNVVHATHAWCCGATGGVCGTGLAPAPFTDHSVHISMTLVLCESQSP